MYIPTASEWFNEFEKDPQRVRLHIEQLEKTISLCVDRVDHLSKSGDAPKRVQLVAIMHRTQLLLIRLQKLCGD